MTSEQDNRDDLEIPPLEDDPAPIPARPRPMRAIVDAAVARAIDETLKSRVVSRPGFSLLVAVPSAIWKSPVRAHFRARFVTAEIVVQDSASRQMADGDVCDALGHGMSVIGIADNSELLPAAFLRTLDASVSLDLPTGSALAEIIGEITASPAPDVDVGFGAGLTLGDAAAAIRPHDTPGEAVLRIRRAQTRLNGLEDLDDAPPIEQLHGYGDAMIWSLNLVAEVAAYRAGGAWSRYNATALLASAPGLGKTALVRSLAKSLHAPLVATSVSAWFTTGRDSHLGSVLRSAKESHSLAMALARSAGVCIWFLDEIDALPSRATMDLRNRDFWTPIIAEILCLLDGATSAPGLIVIGATNHAGQIDSALVRPGRLYPTITIEPPGRDDVIGILRTHLGADLADVDLTPLADLGLGRSGAMLAAVVAQARAAARRSGRGLHGDDLVRLLAPNDDRPLQVVRTVAIHEAGHAIVAEAVGHHVSVVSIVGSGAISGHTISSSEPIMTRPEFERRIVCILAGRAAEEIALGDVSTGAALDLVEATQMLAGLFGNCGLGDRLTAVNMQVHEILRDPDVAHAVETTLQALYAQARDILHAARPALEAVAEALITRRVLSGDDARAIMKQAQLRRRRR